MADSVQTTGEGAGETTREITQGLQFPEGPVCMADGSVFIDD